MNSFSRVFVTGATGFIGQRLVMRLKENGAKLKVLSRSYHSEYETIVCDLESEVIPEDALVGVDTVFHLVGFAHDLRDTSKVEHLYRTVNMDATVHLVELEVRSEVKQFVFVSSVKAGGYDEESGSPRGVWSN